MQDELQKMQEVKEELVVSKGKKHKQCENNVKDYVNQEVKNRKEQDKKINIYLEDKNYILTQELLKDKKVKEEQLNKFTDWANLKLNAIKS